MNWIKPSEKMPNKADGILIAQGDYITTGCYVNNDMWLNTWFIETTQGEEIIKTKDVDYWMSIPELPGE